MVRELVKKSVGYCTAALVKCGALPRMVVIRADGGLCSQMHFYLVGKILESRGNRVCFDLDWFRKDGKDIDGRFCRNFDLPKLFPNLQIPVINNRLLRQLYYSSFYHLNDYFDGGELDWIDYKAPMYLDGYFRDPEEMFDPLFTSTFQIDTSILDAPNREILAKIMEAEKQDGACAMHVRRGDLAKYNPAYGFPPTEEYFLNSCQLVTSEAPGVRFFIFSDEPDWCKSQLLPKLQGHDATMCDINGSDKGYFDMMLISQCTHQITSQGSLGKYSALLRSEDKKDGLVVILEGDSSDKWANRFRRTAVIDGNGKEILRRI